MSPGKPSFTLQPSFTAMKETYNNRQQQSEMKSEVP